MTVNKFIQYFNEFIDEKLFDWYLNLSKADFNYKKPNHYWLGYQHGRDVALYTHNLDTHINLSDVTNFEEKVYYFGYADGIALAIEIKEAERERRGLE